jgi:hypothetical protein
LRRTEWPRRSPTRFEKAVAAARALYLERHDPADPRWSRHDQCDCRDLHNENADVDYDDWSC